MEDNRGFTLVELLAVIVILAIVMVIATITLNETITTTRTNSFSRTMDIIVQNAKDLANLEEEINTKTLTSRISYDDKEYKIEVIDSGKSKLIVLTATLDGEFKKMNFESIEKNKLYNYENNNKMCTLINSSGVINKPISCVVN